MGHEFRGDEKLIESLKLEFRSHWKSNPRPSISAFLDSRQGLPTFDLAQFRTVIRGLITVDLEMRARGGLLERAPSALDEYVEQFPQLSEEDRRDLGRLESEWLKSPRTLVVTGSDAGQSLSESAETNVPAIQGYSDLSRIGQGALGMVYRATQLGTGRTVAIKCIRPEFEMDDKARQLFVREASIASRLKHQRIVECLGFGFSGLRPYLVMEFVRGEDLEQLVWSHSEKRRVRLSVKIILRVLEALVYSHGQGIVHRDIKPTNILASIVNGRLQLKVSDFGLAKMFETAGHSGITKTGEMCGTLAYMSPEQVMDSRRAGPESDVYSSIVCLYRLLTKEFPHPDGTMAMMLHHRLNEKIRSPQQFNSDIPDELALILEQGLSADSRRRYKTAESLMKPLSCLSLFKT